MNSSGFCTSSSTLLENPLHDRRAYAELSANLEGRVVNPMTVLIEEDDEDKLRPLVAIERESGSVSDIFRSGEHLHLENLEMPHLLLACNSSLRVISAERAKDC